MGLSEDQKAMLRLLAQREEGYGDIAALRGLGVDDVRARVKEAIAGLDSSDGLAEDQKAMLRLLAQREEGYGDIAALLGLGVDDVRARVKGALAGLDGAGGPAPAPPKPAREPSPPSVPVPKPPAEPEPADETAAQPASAEPAAPVSPAPSRPTAKGVPSFSLPRNRRRLIELAGGALVVLLFILFATGAIDLGGGDDSNADSGATTTASGQAGDQVTQAVLAPPDGGDAIGQAVFGKEGKKPVLLVQAKNLEPSSAGESYTIWLYRSPQLALRAGAVKVGEDGGIAARFPVPLELLSYVSSKGFNQIYISRTEDAAYKAEIAAAKRQKRLPAYSGDTVLSGPITGPLAER